MIKCVRVGAWVRAFARVCVFLRVRICACAICAHARENVWCALVHVCSCKRARLRYEIIHYNNIIIMCK